MKYKYFFIRKNLVAIVLLFSVYTSASSGNSNVNGWELEGMNAQSYLSRIDKNNKHSGSASAFISSNKKDCSGKWATLMQLINSDEYRGKRTRLSAWVKTENLDEWVGLWMRMDDEDIITALDNMQDRRIKGTTGWKKYEIVLDADTSTDYIFYGIILNGNGRAWIDDVMIEIVGKDVPLTNINRNNELNLSNLDFENISTNNRPTNWGGTTDWNGFEVEIDTSICHSGSKSALLQSTNKKIKEGNFGTIVGEMYPDNFLGTRLKMSGWVRTEAVKEAALWMRIDRNNYKVLAFDNMESRSISGTTDWKKYEIVLDVPFQSTNINFGALLNSTGKLWLDEIKFEVVDKDVALTSIGIDCISNLSFEHISFSNVPTYWGRTIDNYGYKISSDTSFFHDGSKSILLQSIKDKGICAFISHGSISGYAFPDDFCGKRIRLSGWIKTKNIRKGGLWMRIEGNERGETISYDGMKEKIIKGTTDWKKHEIVLDVPIKATNMSFGATFAGKGKLWLDELKIEIVSKDIASTNVWKNKKELSSKKAKRKTQMSKNIEKKPLNRDFEN